MTNEIQFLLYNLPEEEGKVQVIIKDETIWSTQKAISQLFGVGVPAISKHLKNIFEEGELMKEVVVSKMEITTSSISSPSSKMFLRCLDIAGTPTPNSSAIAFCVSQIVSFLTMTLTDASSPGTL